MEHVWLRIVCSTLDIFLFCDKRILQTEVVDVWWKFEVQFLVDPLLHESLLMDFIDPSRVESISLMLNSDVFWIFSCEFLKKKLSGLSNWVTRNYTIFYSSWTTHVLHLFIKFIHCSSCDFVDFTIEIWNPIMEQITLMWNLGSYLHNMKKSQERVDVIWLKMLVIRCPRRDKRCFLLRSNVSRA